MPASISITYTIRDAKGATSTHTRYLPSTSTLLELDTYAKSYAGVLDPVIDGVIDGASIAIPVDLSGQGLTATPLATCDVEDGALFLFRTAGGFNTKSRVPTFSETLYAAGSQAVDFSGGPNAQTAFRDAIVTGLGGTAPTDARDDDITALKEAYQQFVRSR